MSAEAWITLGAGLIAARLGAEVWSLYADRQRLLDALRDAERRQAADAAATRAMLRDLARAGIHLEERARIIASRYPYDQHMGLPDDVADLVGSIARYRSSVAAQLDRDTLEAVAAECRAED